MAVQHVRRPGPGRPCAGRCRGVRPLHCGPGAILGIFPGPTLAAINELFSTRVRCGGFSLGHSFSVSAFGGTAPFLVTVIVARSGVVPSPACYIMASALITLVVVLATRETAPRTTEAAHARSGASLPLPDPGAPASRRPGVPYGKAHFAMTSQWQLRAAFAARLSDMYGQEVPLYTTLVDVSREVNEDVLRARGAGAERLGSISRVTAERHGAIRVGTPREMAQVARVFGALGMRPVGFYDLREAATSAVPVVSTAFRPVQGEELARNPFRVFTSMLTPSDPRFFDDDLRTRLENFLGGRELFPQELLALADRAEAEGELPEAAAERFLQLAVHAFELSAEPVDKTWYETLERVSAVAADIGGVRSTHVNHLTPRVLDIDELYRRMTERGIEMIDTIQGPPRRQGPDLLLRQTSFRALAEPRAMRAPDGSVTSGTLRVRFGEVEARGIALTRAGRARYDRLLTLVDQQAAEHPAADRTELARTLWAEHFPATEHELAAQRLAHFTYHVVPDRPRDGSHPPADLAELLRQGWLRAEPIVYEDFLPRSAAGIFQSNLTGEGSRNNDLTGTVHDSEWLSAAINREVLDPFTHYEQQQNTSLTIAARTLQLDGALD